MGTNYVADSVLPPRGLILKEKIELTFYFEVYTLCCSQDELFKSNRSGQL